MEAEWDESFNIQICVHILSSIQTAGVADGRRCMVNMRRHGVGDAMGLRRRRRLGHGGPLTARLELDGSWAVVHGGLEDDVDSTDARRFAAERDGLRWSLVVLCWVFGTKREQYCCAAGNRWWQSVQAW